MPTSLTFKNRLAVFGVVTLLIIGIAVADWLIDAETPLGLLYLLPVALAGTILTWRQIAVLATACTLLAEQFDGFLWTPLVGIPRDCLYFFAFCGVGLFVREAVNSRRRSAIHMADLESQIQSRKDAEEHLNALIESSPVAILTTDAAGTVLLANDAANRLFAVAPHTLTGQSISAYLPALTKVPPLRNGQPSFRTVMQCRGQRHDGEVFIAEVWFSTYLTSTGPRLTAMAVDTSQDMRDREEANLYHLLAGSRILVGAVSHEVRNVCGAIALVHENLARHRTLEGNQDFEALGTLVLALEKIASMDLRQSAQQATSVDLASFLEELRVIIGSALHEQGIHDHWLIDPDLPAVWADRQSLMQVFLNLARNSEAAMDNQPNRNLIISARAQPHQVLISVTDSGIGVQHPDLLFKPFQQQASQTGLGLFLSRALMRSFKGDLHYQPGGEGATFIVQLTPILDSLDEPDATTRQSEDPPPADR
jgi:two-component system sensor kinase FixL